MPLSLHYGVYDCAKLFATQQNPGLKHKIMAIEKLSTKHLLAFVGMCGAAYCATPVVVGVAAGSLLDVFKDDIKKLFGGLLGHAGGGLIEKYFEYKEEIAHHGHKHHLRELLLIAVNEVLNTELKRLQGERKYLGAELLKKRMGKIGARLDTMMSDDRYQAITEASLPEFFVPRLEDFVHVRALTPDLWLEILGGVVHDVADTVDPSAKAQKREGLESAAKALHENLPMELVVTYRKTFAAHPEVYVAVQTSLSQLMMEELRTVGMDVNRLAAVLGAYQEKSRAVHVCQFCRNAKPGQRAGRHGARFQGVRRAI